MATVQEVRRAIQGMITSWLGEVKIDGDNDFVFPLGSAVAFGRVLDWGDGDVVFNVFSPVLHEVPLSEDLFRYVATEFFVLGNFIVKVDESGKTGRLDFNYRLFANDIDQSELQKAVSAVVTTADGLDDELQKRFGGRRTSDLD